MQARRDRDGQGVCQYIATLLVEYQLALQYVLGQLLDKQWHTVAALDNLVDHFTRQCFAAGDLRYKSGSVEPIQAMKRQHRHMRLAGRGLQKLGAESYYEQHWQIADPMNNQVE